MATSVDEIVGFLEDAGVRFGRAENADALVASFQTEHYRAVDGDDALFVVVLVEEEGRYLKVFAPQAFEIPDEHLEPFLRACAMVQYRTKLVQFEWDPQDGLIPIVEFPLEDAALTAAQLRRCMIGLVAIVDEYYDVLSEVARTGVVDADHIASPELARVSGDWEELLATFPPSLLEAALERARQR